MSANQGHHGRPWRRARAQVLAVSDICWICGKRGANSVDHVIALAHGGAPLDPANLRPAHLTCNSRRGTGLKPRKQPTSRQW